MEYQIRNAGMEHLEQLEVLEQKCFSIPWTQEQLQSQLPDGQHCFLIAVAEDSVLGYVGMMHVLDEGYISNVAVSPAVRRNGIADALMIEILQCAEKLMLSFVTLEVRESNIPARNLYEKHGFQAVGLRKNYYDSPKENAILMTKFLK